MNRDDILKMKAGNKLDTLIELHVFKWPKAYDDAHDIPHYSSDISAAWGVVEKMQTNDIIDIWYDKALSAWFCEWVKDGKGDEAEASTAPLAICRAALLAVMEL